MTTKGILRYVIAVVILSLVLAIALPYAGIPHTSIVPPPLAYLQASGKTDGYVTLKDTAPTANLFHVGDIHDYIWYQYRAPALPRFGQHVVPIGQTAVYKGHAEVDATLYSSVAVGQVVPVKYDPSDPMISGITSPGGGRNVEAQGSLLGWWLAWDLGILAVAYPFAMLLERFFLRESY